MALKEDIEFNLNRGAVQIAKKLASALLLQEHRAEFDKVKREEYELIFPTYRDMTDKEKIARYEEYLANCELDNILPNERVSSDDFNYEQVEIEYITKDETYLSYTKWLNEVKVISEEVAEVSHLNDDGMKVIDTPYKPAVTEMVRPYAALTVTDELIEAKLLEFDAYAKYKKSVKVNELNNLTVEVNGKVFDAHSEARLNMATAIQASGITNTTTTNWKLHDNSVAEVTVEELQSALVLSLTKVATTIGIN